MTKYTEVEVNFVFSNGDTHRQIFKISPDLSPQEAWDSIRETIGKPNNIHTADGVFINMDHVTMALWINNPNKVLDVPW